MNHIVRAWNRSVSRPKYNGPDAVSVDDRKISLAEIEMAERKKPQTDPVLDNSAVNANPKLERTKVVTHLNKMHYNNVIRFIKRAPLDRVLVLREVTYNTLKRLQVKRDESKAVAKVPDGSDHGDVGTLKTWMDSLTKNDKKAIKQVVAIDATCVARSR